MSRITPSNIYGASHAAAAAAAHTLQREGNTIKTPRYDVVFQPDRVRVFDRETETWFEVWGDPHITTGDEQQAGFGITTDFHEGNVTVDLLDGTKVTFKPTATNDAGISWVDKVAIMNGTEAIVVSNIHGQGGPQFGQIGQNAALVDEIFDDGTVLYVENEVDDLFLGSSGQELVGGLLDNIDDLGGRSKLDFGDRDRGPAWENGGPGRPKGPGAIGGGSSASNSGRIIDRLFAILAELEAELDDTLGELEGVGNQDEAKRNELVFKVQHLQQQMQQIVATATNVSKIFHDTAMSIVNNTRS